MLDTLGGVGELCCRNLEVYSVCALYTQGSLLLRDFEGFGHILWLCGGCGWMWVDVGGCGWVWVDVGGCG